MNADSDLRSSAFICVHLRLKILLTYADRLRDGGPHLRGPQLITLVRRMKPIRRKILGMRTQLAMRELVDIKNRHTVTRRNLFQSLTKAEDLLLIFVAQRPG